ncbi:Histidine kinase [Salegentibacter echinorum]|uniref:Histidine kinase n=1 Tax=Salegentibacter echinorum TaxID=1073325 RepID=A0A1M5KSZ6_SALEC|nr:histidine kinase [Salegentibacter echinorum]SHG55982.1 Histidine kinase [Salegentibacter echinorum]
MKRIITLILILIITPFFIHSDKSISQQVEEIEASHAKQSELKKWDYIKDRIFDGKTPFFGRLEGDITIVLADSTKKEDSLLVEEAILDIREILPNKEIRILKPSGKITEPWIHIVFVHESIYTNPNKQIIDLANGHFLEIPRNVRKGNKLEIGPYMRVYILEERSYIANSHEVRKKSLKAGLLRKLVFLQNDSEIEGRSLFRSKKITSLDFFIRDRDKFLLQKLYSDDFLEQFEDYLYANYPWRYAYSFLHKKSMDLLAIGVVSLLGLVVFLLLFSFFQNKKFKYSYLNYFLPVLLIWAHLANLHWIYNYLTDFDSFISWWNSVLFMMTAIPLFALLTSFIMWATDKFLVKKQINFSSQLLQKVLFTFIAFIAPLILIFFFNGHRDEGIDFFLPGLFLWIALSVGRGFLIYLNHFSENLIKQKDLEMSKLKEVNSQAQVKLLQSQINPHFLYNALNSIASLAHKNADKTEKMALSLSDLFKYTINRKGRKDSTIGDEVEMVNNYLEVEQIRFGDRLNFTLNVDKSLENTRIPMFLIQPLIENSVKHGISKLEDSGQISLIIQKEEVGFSITVEDNGPNFQESLVSGHGLQTVFDLLRLTYSNKASISWKNAPTKHIKISIENEY